MFSWGIITGMAVTLLFAEIGKAGLTWFKQKFFK
jgi:hypothetical protein